MPVKINAFEVENVKRVKAVAMQPTSNGLTVIGGKNGQGKTSVLDAIAWALGGNKFAPSTPYREGSTIPPHLKINLSNGVVVERSGKNGSLKVIDSTGNKGGQALLDEFVSQFALNLPKFINANGKEKADTLLQIIGVGDKLYELESVEKSLYSKRHAIGQIADQKKKYAVEMVEYRGVPDEPVSAAELIKQQQEILARNGENQRKRERLDYYENELKNAQYAFDEAKKRLDKAMIEVETARKSAENLTDESTAELERNISQIDEINRKVRANLDKAKAEDDAKLYADQYDSMTKELNNIRKQKYDLLNNAELPLPGLSVQDGELTYNGFKWDNMSGSEQLKVATAIVRKLNPECGFVLIDKLEQMDVDTLNDFGKWLESEGLQAIATRVSSGDECSVIIEDGYVKAPASELPPRKEWKAGVF